MTNVKIWSLKFDTHDLSTIVHSTKVTENFTHEKLFLHSHLMDRRQSSEQI